jgi:hypothetical protein
MNMKKKIIVISTVVLIVGCLSFNLCIENLKYSNDLQFFNVEALAQGEGGESTKVQNKVDFKTTTSDAVCIGNKLDMIVYNYEEGTDCNGNGSIDCTPSYKAWFEDEGTALCIH